MTITLNSVENIAPDQKSLTAAKKLLKPAKWILKQSNESLIWAHCQGSGANPYMTVIDTSDQGYKCTCPSRKFPCKHALALMWMVAESDDIASDYPTAEIPQWVTDWQGRRRPSVNVNNTNNTNATSSDDNTNDATKSSQPSSKKNIHRVDEPTTLIDPEAQKINEQKKQQAAAKRAIKTKQATDKAITQGLMDYEQWLNDQLRTGLGNFLDNASERCRKISARLVDAKATTLASRLDELPSKLLNAHKDMRLRVATNELSKTVWLMKAWQKDPENKDIRRAINTVENRNKLLNNTDNLQIFGIWQVVAEHIETRKDGLISHATWLRLLKAEQNDSNESRHQGIKQSSQQANQLINHSASQLNTFAILQDYYPVSSGRNQVVSQLGDMMRANVVFYPSAYPLRAVLSKQELLSASDFPPAEQEQVLQDIQQANGTTQQAFFQQYQHALAKLPWLDAMPFMLPSGRFVANIRQTNQHSKSKKSEPLANIWWQGYEGQVNEPTAWQLPFLPNQHLDDSQWALLLASEAKETMILWDGVYAKMGSIATSWGIL